MDRGLMASGVQFFVDGRCEAEINFSDVGRDDTPYSFLLMVPQYDIEAILNRDLVRLGVPVEYKTEVTGFKQSASGVVVEALMLREHRSRVFLFDRRRWRTALFAKRSVCRLKVPLIRRASCSPIAKSIGRATTTT